MTIDFHCEHCRTLIRAPSDTAGRKGRCPQCKNVVYIPLPPEESGEIPLAPEDPEDERRRREAERERHAVERALLREKTTPGDPPGRPTRGGGAARPAQAVDARRLVCEFLSAMAESRMDAAERHLAALAGVKAEALAAIEAISSSDPPPSDVPKLPRPLLVGFLKQLRSRL